jgi:class 3 adenylate cyclase/pimeloyl-ACP methyl ester carboxylesterase
MSCPRCGQENRPQAKFCEACAAPLIRRCAKCGSELSSTARFCSECAHPVQAPGGAPATVVAPEAYTPKHLAEKILTSRGALEGERKQVTVLFADLKGSMELLADRDPEEARRLLDPVLERMMEAVHRYEGTVNQVMGDGIMALFGAPLAHEDHAVRACYAALRMQESVKHYAEGTRREHGVTIRIRVGLNSGEVVVRAIGSDLHMDYTAVGQTTHLAARMEQLADPGAVLLTPETLALAEDFVRVHPLGPTAVKGLAAPIEVFELTGVGAARSRLQAAAARGLTRFVGRDAEMEHLRRLLQSAGRGQGQVVAVVAEAGVGKSRLYHEFTRSHRTADWLVLESGSVSYGTATSYLPLIDLLKGYFGIEDRDDTRKIREKVTGKLITLDESLMPFLPGLLALLHVPVDDPTWEALDPPQRRQQTLEASKRLLLREARLQPLVLVFEDLHWIDSESQAFLDALVESLPAARILLLVNYRPEYQHGWGQKSYYTQLRIDRALIERTQGNPFFLEESVQALVETGVLAGERGGYRLAGRPETIQVPASVRAVLAARIDRLAPEDKALLQTAAVIGKDVPLALLQPVAELPDASLRQGLERLRAGEFLYEASLFPDVEYTFKHALTHEVAYGGILHERRRGLHARIARAMERLHAARLDEHVERLAAHAAAGELWPEAAAYFQRAAEKAKDRYAYPAALGAGALALDAATRGRLPDARRACLVMLGDLHSLCGDLALANARYEEAGALAADEAARTIIANKRHRLHRVDRRGALAVYEHGSGGETLLIINPLVYGLATFQPLIEELCQEFRIITIDPRGTGASDPLPEGYTLRDHMEDVHAVIDALGLAPLIGIGISRGGNLLIKLAVAHPGDLKAIVAIGTPTYTSPIPTPGARREFEEALRRGDVEAAVRMFAPTIVSEPGTRDVLELIIQQSLKLPPETVLGFFRPDPECNIVPLLERVDIPVLVTHGTDDRRVPFAEGRYLAEHIPGARLYAFEGLGHLPIFTGRREFCDVLRRFARGERRAARPGPESDWTCASPHS